LKGELEFSSTRKAEKRSKFAKRREKGARFKRTLSLSLSLSLAVALSTEESRRDGRG